MDTAATILFALRSKGAKIWTDGQRLHYDAPRGLLNAADLERLRQHKSEIIRFLSRPTNGTDHPLGARDPGEPIPVTLIQQYFYNTIIAAGGRSRRLPAVLLRLSGPLHVDALEEALNRLVCRHEILRTRITRPHMHPMQEIDAFHPFHLERTDLRALPAPAREIQATQLIRELTAARIDVSSESLFLPHLLGFSETDHILLIAMDHILFNASSTEVLQRDLCALYAQAAHDAPIVLPDVELQYADFAVWQHKTRASHIDVHDGYWHERLHDARHLAVFSEPVPTAQSPRNARWRFRFDSSLSAGLRAFSLGHRTTLRMSLLSAYVATLSRWCATRDLVVPVPTIVSRHRELQNTLGPLGTFLYLRLQLHSKDSFADLLGRVTDEFNAAFEHDDSAKILAREPKPPFATNAGFNFSSADVRSALHPACDWSDYGSGLVASHFHVEIAFRNELSERLEEPQLLMFDTGAELAGRIVYRADRAGLRTLKQFEQAFRKMAEHMVRSPLAALASVPLS